MWVEALRTAWDAIWAHRMRSALTTLGIFIGVMAVVAVMAVTTGFFGYFQSQFEALGANTFFVYPNFSAYNNMEAAARSLRLDLTDASAIAQVSHVTEVCPQVGRMETLVSRGKRTRLQMVATGASWFRLNALKMDQGRFFTSQEESQGRRVLIIGPKVAEDLGLATEGVLDSTIRVAGRPYRVIGLLVSQGASFGQDRDNIAIIPLHSALRLYGSGIGKQLTLQVQVETPEWVDGAVEDIQRVLRRRHRIRADQPQDFRILTQKQVTGILGKISMVSTLIVGAIVGITLIVGGIGIANILLVSVAERTREIGIRMAVGARGKDIRRQFLLEAVLLSTLGGVLGMLTGIALASLIVLIVRHWVDGFPVAQAPLWSLAMALGFAMITGMLAGVYPASRAAKLDPVQALSRE